MKNSMKAQIIGLQMSSITYPLGQRVPLALLTNTADQSRDDRSSAMRRSRVHSVLNRMNKFGKKADNFAHGIKEHVKLGARILQFGGFEKIFTQLFSFSEGEKLLKACRCYLSTTAGPIAGLLFISTEKIAFCSQKSIQLSERLRARYKVVIPISKIMRVDQSENVEKPSHKYIEIVTVDNFDFWFAGFLNHQKAFKCLQQSLSQS